MAKEITRLGLLTHRAPVSFEPDLLAPHQYLKTYQRTNPVEPEKALMFAVLAEAIDTYQRYAFSKSSRGQALFGEVEAWFWGEQADFLFSFPNICEVFGLDAGFLQRGLMQWTASRQRYKRPRKKIQLHMERGRARRPLNSIGKKTVLNRRGLVALGP
jgi:hypothetical protein